MTDQQSAESATFAAVVAAAQRENLGQHRASFRPKRTKTFPLVALIVLGVLSLIIVVGVVFLVAAFMTPNLNSRRAAKRIHFFERGLIVADAKGPTGVYRWDSLSVLQSITRRYVNGVYVGTTYIYTLTTREGASTKVTGFYDKPDEWGPLIQSEILRAQLPAVMATLETGTNMQFGPLTINRGGIATSSKSLRWNEIENIDVFRGYLRIKKAGGWMRWSSKPVSQIPNFFVFLTAANRLRETYPSSPQPTQPA
jgi:uncharacterized protein DUF6585